MYDKEEENSADEFGETTLKISFIVMVLCTPLCFLCLFIISKLTIDMGKFLFYFLYGIVALIGMISFSALIAATGASLGILFAMALQELDP